MISILISKWKMGRWLMRRWLKMTVLFTFVSLNCQTVSSAECFRSRPKAFTGQVFTDPQSCTDTVPRPIGFVSDYEHIYTPAEQRILDSILAGFQQRTTIQIALVTIDTSMIIKEGFDDFVLRIGKVWAVGSPEKRNGIIIGISRTYHKIRIEKDYGIHKVLSNTATKAILDTYFIPLFKKDQYYEGTFQGLQALMNRLE